MILLFEGELLQKFNRIDGSLVEDNLGIDVDKIDDTYFRKYMEQKHYNKFIPNMNQKQDGYTDIHDYYFDNDMDYYNGYDDVYYQGYEYDFDEEEEIDNVVDSVFKDFNEEMLKTRITPKYVYLMTSHKTQLIQCDKCKNVFCDYNGMYVKNQKKRKVQKDYCLSCWIEKKKVKSLKLSRMAKALEKYNGIMASKNQRYIAQLLQGELNYRIGDWFGDILVGENLIIEYDGGGHFISIQRGYMTED